MTTHPATFMFSVICWALALLSFLAQAVHF